MNIFSYLLPSLISLHMNFLAYLTKQFFYQIIVFLNASFAITRKIARSTVLVLKNSRSPLVIFYTYFYIQPNKTRMIKNKIKNKTCITHVFLVYNPLASYSHCGICCKCCTLSIVLMLYNMCI